MPKTTRVALSILLVMIICTPFCPAGEVSDSISIVNLPPSVIKTVPQCGDDSVDPNLTEIKVTFSKDMKVTGHCWSWCSVQDDAFPKLSDTARYLDDKRTCVLPVNLEPEKTYAIWINVDKYLSFQDPEGHSAVPYLLVFKTGQK